MLSGGRATALRETGSRVVRTEEVLHGVGLRTHHRLGTCSRYMNDYIGVCPYRTPHAHAHILIQRRHQGWQQLPPQPPGCTKALTERARQLRCQGARRSMCIQCNSIAPHTRRRKEWPGQRQAAGSTTQRTGSPSQQPRSAADGESFQILEAFYYGRAFAQALNRRLGELVVDVVSEGSKLVAEQPQRMQEFQDEVRMLVRQEMSGSAQAGPGSMAVSSSAVEPNAPQDLQAVVDDLRAEIASSRAVLQQIKAGAPAAAPVDIR